jgi:hypothetical protein
MLGSYWPFKKKVGAWECSSVVQSLPSMLMSWDQSTKSKKKKVFSYFALYTKNITIMKCRKFFWQYWI